MKTTNFSELDSQDQELLKAATTAMEEAYNPYSHFFVGAALIAEGKITVGANVENSAYGSSICAERSAIVSANAQGLKKANKLAVIVRGKNGAVTEPSAPCGACRQMIYELSQVSDVDIEIIMSNTDMSKIIIATISELLPLAFGPKDLE